MKRLALIFLPLLTSLTSCTSTGDWNEDSLFFSPTKADRRLNTKVVERRDAEHGVNSARNETRRLERRLERTSAARRRESSKARQLRAEIASLERERSDKERLSSVVEPSVGSSDALGELRREINALSVSIARKREELALILSIR